MWTLLSGFEKQLDDFGRGGAKVAVSFAKDVIGFSQSFSGFYTLQKCLRKVFKRGSPLPLAGGPGVSIMVLNRILMSMGVFLASREVEELFYSLTRYIGVEGSQVCDVLEKLWKDDYYRQAIEEFIRMWIRKRRRIIAEKDAEIAYAT